ncbi:MAG TPA: hypothetical protein DCL77_14570 [Prolixibacteraceae bacterium]|jgi:MoaA/NifB/PqqE/SkfB family radical SAM enzyme|nr:hypothetical protein [Prolixibacteraceae bacterium]
MKKEEQKAGNCTIINGVVLTDSAIGFILSLQTDNNGYLNEVHEKINNTISILIDGLDETDPIRLEEMVDNIKYLNSFIQKFKFLKKS